MVLILYTTGGLGMPDNHQGRRARELEELHHVIYEFLQAYEEISISSQESMHAISVFEFSIVIYLRRIRHAKIVMINLNQKQINPHIGSKLSLVLSEKDGERKLLKLKNTFLQNSPAFANSSP